MKTRKARFVLMVGSTVGTMIVSLAADVVLFVSCVVVVTLCVLQFHWPSDLFIVCAYVASNLMSLCSVVSFIGQVISSLCVHNFQSDVSLLCGFIGQAFSSLGPHSLQSAVLLF